MLKIEWLKTANEDLKQIYNYIYIDSVYYANKTIINISDRVQALKLLPRMGRKVPEYNKKELRELVYKSYRLIYEITNNKILIHRIWHSARQLPEKFKS